MSPNRSCICKSGRWFKELFSGLKNLSTDPALALYKLLLCLELGYKWVKLITRNFTIPDENGRITEADFAELLLAYAGYPAKKKARMLKRVKKTYVNL